MKNIIKQACLLCVLSLWFSVSVALNTDQNQPLTVAADKADINNHSGIGKYEGNVKVNQGTSHLTATSATTYTNKSNQLTLAIINGDASHLAHFWTLTDPDKPPLHARAVTIKFYPAQHLIDLIGNAKVTQGADSYTAPEIKYNTQTQHVISGHNKNERTTIIIHPSQHKSQT